MQGQIPILSHFDTAKLGVAKDLDQHIGDLHPAIVDREIEIIHGLEERVMVHDQAVAAACDACAELDW